MSDEEINIDTIISWPPPYTVKRHPLAKYIKLRASRADGLVISMPPRTSLKHIPPVLEKHREWILDRLNEIQAKKTEDLPLSIDFLALGEKWMVSYSPASSKMKIFIRSQLKELVVSGVIEKAKCLKEIKKWVKKKAVDYLSKELAIVSKEIGLPFNTVSVRDQKTLWGSCSIHAAISLNYKLVFLPNKLARHVLIHELSHTRHHNHSLRFWELVAKFDANWQEHKHQLREADRILPSWL